MFSIDHLQYVPPILDFEASSLSDTSYPISAGLRAGNCLKYWIIKPRVDWIDWALDSQAIHGLKRSDLEDYGIDTTQVYDEMRGLLVGIDVIYSDNPHWEQRWLACLGPFDLEIRNIQELLPKHNQHLLKQTFEKQFQAHKLIPHRADHDALALSLAVYHLQNG